MAELSQVKLKQLTEALASLREALGQGQASKLARDGVIQRFEYTLETFWKFLQIHLAENEGVKAYSPKSVFREAGNAGILNEAQVVTCLQMVDDRNDTTHLYNELKIENIYSRIASYTQLMKDISDKLP